MQPESFNRLQNPSEADFDRFVAWLFSNTLEELRAARGDLPATRTAWIRYFQRGLKADLLLDELMKQVRELFLRARYPEDEAKQVLEMIKQISLKEMGFKPPQDGTKFGERTK
jgi:hypothetical protein